MLKKTLLAAVVAASSLTAMLPMAAHAQYTAIVRVAPPAPIYEAAPAPRSGYVWAPGHHEFRNGQYVWVQGYWLQERPGYAYIAPRRTQRGDGQWAMIGGGWERGPYGDRDHDGIANRYDRNDGRYARRDDRRGPYGDRDGDGVQNSRDRHPDNPRHW